MVIDKPDVGFQRVYLSRSWRWAPNPATSSIIHQYLQRRGIAPTRLMGPEDLGSIVEAVSFGSTEQLLE